MALAAGLGLAACGAKTPTRAPVRPSSSDADVGNPLQPGDTVDPTLAAQPPMEPNAQDVASNPQTQGQVAAAGLAAAAAAAAAGAQGGATAGASLLDAPAASAGKTTQKGSLAASCYGPSHLQTNRLDGMAWPESNDVTNVFADSKNDPNDPLNETMNVEPALLVYPTTGTPTATLTLAQKFVFADMVEVVTNDTRQLQSHVGDDARTVLTSARNDVQHAFWVVAGGPLACTGSADAPHGASGDADGAWVKVPWGNAAATTGLSLLSRYERSERESRTFRPRTGGKLVGHVASLTTDLGATGYRLAQFAAASTSPAALPGAAVSVTKTVTHAYSDVQQTLDASGAVTSDVGGVDEVRATSPLVITDFLDQSGKPLQHVIASGSILHTAKDQTGAVRFFTRFDLANVTFDRAHSTVKCLPVSGTVTMTTYDKEGGTQQRVVTITYTSTPATGGAPGQVSPTLAVTGDDANGTEAQWMLLHVDRHCDLAE